MRDSRRAPIAALIASILLMVATPSRAEDGYRLWLRYDPIPAKAAARDYLEGVDPLGDDPRIQSAARELQRAISGIYGPPVPGRELRRDYVVMGTPDDLKSLGVHLELSGLGDEGYLVQRRDVQGAQRIVVSGNTGTGVLYGTFALIREIQLGHRLNHLNLRSAPRYSLRMLDHWDNLDGTVERGYAGPSLWDWRAPPGRIDPRYADYARANASVGINAVVLNNVNASADILTAPYLQKVSALAHVFRPWGIRVYLSARFSAPIDIGRLETADPLDPAVRKWWKSKADEIYRLVPDFGGFLVKANSEGQPGPQSYGRSHADGANMLAEALAPHHGVVLWRAFVYSGAKEDRAKQAYEEFKPLDGKFADNVIVQIKNGPIDFQPREPFHPLFGQMPRTDVAMEVQLTREYLGQGSGIVFLAPMWSEALGADTCSPRCGTPVRATIKAMAGVSNVGGDRNWTGTHFDQANWYAFGRLAWNPTAAPASIAEEWTRMTWGSDSRLLRRVTSILAHSREAAVDYMTPLGLAHQMATDHHYGPGPWVCDLAQPSWNPCYYSRADAHGIGFDRTASGSDAAGQYEPKIGGCFADLKCVSDQDLLWFHHLPWTYRMRSGRILWEELVARYDGGLGKVQAAEREWNRLRTSIDAQRHAAVAATLGRQRIEAKWWRDASIAYWQSLSRLPLPKGHASLPHALSWYKAIQFETVPGYLVPGTGQQLSCVPPRGGPPCAL
jgi:alpha-glucuronidase